jgi:hypothetical protein
MSERTPEGSDRPDPEDEVFLAVLSNSGRSAVALTPDDERLLDDWVAGRLPADAAERAAALTRRNARAAERVLEHRLLDAARTSPPIPQALTARILTTTPPPRTSPLATWWRSLGQRRWLGIAAVAVLAGIAAIAVAPMLQQALRGDSTVQVAMMTFTDRTPLFESSDIRMRGAGTPQATPGDQRFRDIDLPTATLRSLIGSAGPAQAAASKAIEAVLPPTATGSKGPLRLVVDDALKSRIDASNGPAMPVRAYDLNDPRSVEIRRLVPNPADNTRTYLLTTRPQ